MNIKKLIVPIIALIAVIAALIVGVILVNKPSTNPVQEQSQISETEASIDTQIDEADAAIRTGNYSAALEILEKVRVSYQDQNKQREADEISDKIESIKSLQKNQKVTTDTNKLAAPVAE